MEKTLSPAMQLPKVMESRATVRFQDCDPFNHLNNARYLDYFINAREDHILEHYGLNMYQIATETGMGWVVGRSQIAYLKPARLMEEVVIESQLIRYGERDIMVEMRMLNTEKTHLKALLWINFIHFRLATGKSEAHAPRFMELFEKVVLPTEATNFDERFISIAGISQKPLRN